MSYETTAETITFIHGQAADNDDMSEPDKDLEAPDEVEAAPGEDDKIEEEEPTVE